MCAAAISFARLRRLYFAALGSKGRWGGPWRAVFRAAHLPSCTGNLWRNPRHRGRRNADLFFFRAAMNAFVKSWVATFLSVIR